MTEKTYDENWAKAKLKKLLDEAGVMHFASQNTGMGTSGVSDRLGVKNGIFFAIEVKRPGRRGQANRGCSALQAKFLNQVAAHGGVALVFDGEDDDIELLNNVSSAPKAHIGVNTLDLDYWKKTK